MVLRLFLWPLSDQTKENKKRKDFDVQEFPFPTIKYDGVYFFVSYESRKSYGNYERAGQTAVVFTFYPLDMSRAFCSWKFVIISGKTWIFSVVWLKLLCLCPRWNKLMILGRISAFLFYWLCFLDSLTGSCFSWYWSSSRNYELNTSSCLMLYYFTWFVEIQGTSTLLWRIYKKNGVSKEGVWPPTAEADSADTDCW